MAISNFEKAIGDRISQLKNARSGHENQFREIQELVRPNSPDFTSPLNSVGQEKSLRIYDGTARLSSLILANGLDSYVTSDTERWFTLKVFDMPDRQVPFSVRVWMEQVSDIIYREISRPASQFNTSKHEGYLDMVTFGSGAMLSYFDTVRGHLIVRSYPLADVFYETNFQGEVDVVGRRSVMTKRQLQQFFPDAASDKRIDRMKDGGRAIIWHFVLPREDYRSMGGGKSRRPYPSLYFMEQEQWLIQDNARGYDLFPYSILQWAKIAGETYSRSPAETCLPSISMLQGMKREMLLAAQLANRPPVMTEDGSFLQDIYQVPAAIWHIEAGMERPTPFLSGSQPQFTLEMMQWEQEYIRQCYFIDWFFQESKKERQTAFEIADKRDEKLRMLSPIIGRVQNTWGQFLRHTFFILQQAGKIPPPPQELDGLELDIDYVSPAAVAQLGAKRLAIKRTLEDLAVPAQVRPDVYDKFDFDEIAEMYATTSGVPPSVLKSDDQVAQERQARAQQAQQQQLLEAAPGVAKAARDISEVQQ